METAPTDMIERQESTPQKPLEATYVTIVKDIVHKKIPEHETSFGIALDEINRQITGDGLFQWESKKYPGVKFLAGHLTVTPELITKIADLHPLKDETSDSLDEPSEQRLKHYVYFIQPWLGLGQDGSALSALDTGIDRFIREMPRVARAIRNGEKTPTVDIFIHGDPTGLGGEASREFVEDVKENGYEAYGKINAEFMMEHMPAGELDEARVVIQGGSKGTVTADKTSHYLSPDLRERTVLIEMEDEEGNQYKRKGTRGVQRLYDNTAASHGANPPTQFGRSANMGIGMATEIGLRFALGSVKGGQFGGQAQFYEDILKAKGIPEDSEEQRKLKSELWLKGEIKTIGKGTPLDKKQRSYLRLSTPDSVNVNVRNLLRVNIGRVTDIALEKSVDVLRKIPGFGKMEPKPRRALFAKNKGKILTFATSNVGHNFPWVRSVNSGSWAQKMEYVENTKSPKAA